MSKNNKWLFVGIFFTVVVLLGAIFYIYRQHQEISGLEQQFDIQKQELEAEYSQLAVQYEGYGKMNIKSDSLLELWENEKMKVQRLLEELHTVKSTNATRISQLKKELATLRSIMKGYIVQIDSLNALNAQLTQENVEVKQRYNEASQTVSQLSKEKRELSDKVNLASQLNATNIVVTGLDKRGKSVTKISKLVQLSVGFKIARNVTASTGEKIVYVRILKPDNDVLTKNRMDLFKYENKDINYSCRRLFEFTGEENDLVLYWKIEEYLSPGDYRVDIFVDGNMIGQKSFTLDK